MWQIGKVPVLSLIPSQPFKNNLKMRSHRKMNTSCLRNDVHLSKEKQAPLMKVVNVSRCGPMQWLFVFFYFSRCDDFVLFFSSWLYCLFVCLFHWSRVFSTKQDGRVSKWFKNDAFLVLLWRFSPVLMKNLTVFWWFFYRFLRFFLKLSRKWSKLGRN